MTNKLLGSACGSLLLACVLTAWAGDDLIGVGGGQDGDAAQYTDFTRQGSILNTRHNLMQSTMQLSQFGGASNMTNYRNDYGEVCVYCHTPHGANTNAAAPLWNRVLTTATTYQTYNQLGTVTANQTYSQPGGASLPCLSCHDGQQAVDAIINMPGSGRYNPAPSSAGGNTSTDLWTRWNVIGKRALNHASLSDPSGGAQSCLSCHAPTGNNASAVDFTVFAIGTDLRNDHPVGVTYPTVNGTGTDWNTPAGVKTTGRSTGAPNDPWTTLYFEEGTADGKMQKNEIRLYATGEGPEVECASCHDPHGVPGPGGKFNKTFLRKNNTGSAVCLTCHAK